MVRLFSASAQHNEPAELTLESDGRKLRFILLRATADAALAATTQWNAQLLRVGAPLQWSELAVDSCFVIPLLNDTETATAA